MTYIIVKPTRREREERLAESRTHSTHNVVGVVRRTEEAFELARQREREGIPFDREYAVSLDAPESKIAEGEVLLRAGINPETGERLHSDSTRHG